MDMLAIGEVAGRSGMAAVRAALLRGPGADQRDPDRGRRPAVPAQRAAPAGADPGRSQRRGLSLPEIRAALDTLPAERPPTAADWARLSRGWRDRLDEQIAALTQLRDGLTSCIGCGCLSLEKCALSNPGDVAGASTDRARAGCHRRCAGAGAGLTVLPSHAGASRGAMIGA